ncbi:MAG: TolC family protein [Deltaproteobacteria bacterium]|nr:MAG: TolC family protein [Deltaproteobacteria bacterium]
MIALLLGMALASDVPIQREGAVYTGSLAATQDRAVRRAVAVELAVASADQARGEASVWRGRALPAVSLFTQLGVGAGFTPFGFERPIPWQVGLGAQGAWSVVDPSTWAAATSARRTARGREAIVQWTKAQARRDAAVAYTEAWSAARAAALLREAVQELHRAEDAIRRLVEAEVRPAVDLARARADALEFEAQAEAATGEATAACARLQALVDAELSGRCELEAPQAGPPERGPDRHPALAAAEEALGAAKASGDQARFAYLPSINADGTVAEYIVADRGTGLGWSANITLDVPLTIATTGPGDLAMAKAEQRLAAAELDGQERDLAATLLAAEARLKASELALLARRGSLNAAEEAFRRTDERYRNGIDGVTSWLDARRVSIEAKVSVVYAEAAVVAATAELEGVRGVD